MRLAAMAPGSFLLRINLEVEEREESRTIHGSVVTSIRDRVRELFDGPVRAEVEETTTTGPAIEEPRITYRLVDVRPANTG